MNVTFTYSKYSCKLFEFFRTFYRWMCESDSRGPLAKPSFSLTITTQWSECRPSLERFDSRVPRMVWDHQCLRWFYWKAISYTKPKVEIMFTSPGSSWSLASQHRRVLAILVGVTSATTNDQPGAGYDKIPAFHLFMYWHQTWRILWRWKLRSIDARSHRCSLADRFRRSEKIWKPGPTTRWCSRSK